MNESRNHHYLSQCYLKGFTRDGTKGSHLFAINLGDGSSFFTIPRNVGAKRDFNRIEGYPPGKLEQELSGFESEVDSALCRVRQRQSIDDPNDWNDILNLISLFAVRNPRLRNQAHNFKNATRKVILDLVLATPERWEHHIQKMESAGEIKKYTEVSYEQAKEFHERGKSEFKTSNSSHIAQEFMTHDSVLKFLAERVWRLCVADQESGGYISSDHPVCLMHSDGNKANFQRPVGYESTKSTVCFPISSKLLAIGTFEGSAGVEKLSPFQVAYMNGIICSFAQSQIYAADNTFRIVIGNNSKLVTGTEFSRYLANGNNNPKSS